MKTNGTSRRRSFRTGFIAGLLAGLVASGVMILISTLGSWLSLPEVVGSKLTALMPLAVFAYLQKLIGADAKYYLCYLCWTMRGVCAERGAVQRGSERTGETRATTRVPTQRHTTAATTSISWVTIGRDSVVVCGIGAAAAFERGGLRFAVECWRGQ